MEYDLHAICGIDLLEFFRGVHPWEKLERLVRILQRDPRAMLRAALLDDDDLVDLDDDQPLASAPPIEGWTPEVDLLASIFDRLSDLVVATIAAAGGKAPKIRRLPRPETAYRRAAVRKSRARVASIVSEVNAARDRRRGD